MVRNSDLHTHSYYSDGHSSPRQLVRLAKKRKIKNLALTDHNTTKGIKEAISEGNKIGVNIIPGVEMRCSRGEVLAYFIDIKDKELNKVLRESRKNVQVRVKEKCKNFKKVGYDIDYKELKRLYPKSKGNFTESHPLFTLHLKGYGDPLKIIKDLSKNKEYQKLKNQKDKFPTLIQTIRLIRKANGFPVLAHPWFGGIKKDLKNMKKLVKAGLKGIELSNGDTAPFKPKGSEKKIRALAKKYNLILTKGSDYHGEELVKLMPGNHNLGKNNCDEKIVEQLRINQG